MIPEFLGSLALPVCRLERCGKKPSLPARQTEDAAGVDLAAFLPEGELVIPAGGRALVPTGLTMAVPRGWGGFVLPPAVRSVYLYSYIRIARAISAASFCGGISRPLS